MNYWKESVFVALLAVVVVVGLALRVTASQTDKGKSAQKITASGGKQTGAVKMSGTKTAREICRKQQGNLSKQQDRTTW